MHFTRSVPSSTFTSRNFVTFIKFDKHKICGSMSSTWRASGTTQLFFSDSLHHYWHEGGGHDVGDQSRQPPQTRRLYINNSAQTLCDEMVVSDFDRLIYDANNGNGALASSRPSCSMAPGNGGRAARARAFRAEGRPRCIVK